MLALDSGYPYKRSHLVALRPTKISAMDPPCRLKACPVYRESRHQTDRSACRQNANNGLTHAANYSSIRSHRQLGRAAWAALRPSDLAVLMLIPPPVTISTAARLLP